MTKDLIRYDLLVQDALKGVVRKVLGDAAKHGLSGDHHFYVSFRTDFPGVRISNRLREKYPQDMTIVLQHQYWDLEVDDQGFGVTLSFNDQMQRLRIPFSAIKVFADPGVEFGLQFTLDEDGEPPASEPVRLLGTGGRESQEDEPESAEKEPSAGAEIVALDRFRKK